MTAGPDPVRDAHRFPIFVDDSGRRRRWLRWTGWLIGALASAYLALFVLSVVSSPGLLPLSLPGVGRLLPNAGAPDIPVAGGGHKHPADVVTTSTPSPTPATVTTPLPAVAPTPTRSSPVSGSARPTPSRTVGRTSAPSAVPTKTPTAKGSPTSHPTAHGTGKPTARPTHTPRSHLRRSPTP